MIECRGRNGWFNLKETTVYLNSGGVAQVGFVSRQNFRNVPPIFFSGPKAEVEALLLDLLAKVRGTDQDSSIHERTNEDRAATALAAVKSHGYLPEGEELSCGITDLMADLLHLGWKEGLDLDRIQDSARIHFETESEG
jgi:hypothetical protein